MTDYTKNNDYSDKDVLLTGDPEKLISGADIDSELDEIAVHIATKFDTSDIASQAQAEAGVNNTTLMTPLRVAQLLGIGGSGGGSAGALADILALDDPGDDRILFWDESADEVTFLDIGTNLEITAGAVLNVTVGTIDHDSLLNFVANEHIDMTAVVLTAGEGLAYSVGGTNLAASATVNLDFNSLTTVASVDAVNDLLAIYDASGTDHKKVSIQELLGTQLGEAKYYRSSDITITSTLAVVAFNTVDGVNTLSRGTYSTSTGEYTSDNDGTVVLVSAHFRIDAQGAGEDGEIRIRKNGVTVATQLITNRGKFGGSTSTQSITSLVSVDNTDTIDIQVANDATRTGVSGAGNLYVNFIEMR